MTMVMVIKGPAREGAINVLSFLRRKYQIGVHEGVFLATGDIKAAPHFLYPHLIPTDLHSP